MAPLDRTATHLHQIGGVATASTTGRTTVLHGDGETAQGSVAAGSPADLTAAVAAARAAQPGWAGLEAAERGRLLFRAAELLGEPATSGGSPSTASDDDPATAAADRLARWAGWADKLPVLLGTTTASGPYLALTGPRPLGVVGLVAGGDDLAGLVESLGAALVTGSTTVVLASERRPLPALRLAQTCTAAGVPGGVVNVVVGAPSAGLAAALAEAGIDALDLPPAGGPDPDDAVADAARTATARLLPVLRGIDPADPGAGVAARTRLATLWQPAG